MSDPRHSDARIAHVETFIDLLRSEFSAIPDELNATVTGRLQPTLTRIGDDHAALVSHLRRRSDSGDVVESLGLAEFRKTVVETVSATLVDVVTRLDAANTVCAAFTVRLDRLRQAAGSAPEQLSLPENSSIYDAEPHDSLSRRAFKLWLRTGRKIRVWRTKITGLVRRLVGREPPVAEAPSRSVPLRQLLRMHVDRGIATSTVPIHERVQQELAQRFATIERYATEWAVAVLEVDDEFGLDEPVTPAGTQRDAGTDAVEPSDQDGRDKGNVDAVAAPFQKLVGALDGLAIDALLGDLETVTDSLVDQLNSNLRIAGTPLLRVPLQEPSASTMPPAVSALSACSQRWARWHSEAANRLTLNHSVLVLRESLADRVTTILRDARTASLDPVNATLDQMETWIKDTESKVNHAFEGATPGDAERVAEALGKVMREAHSHFTRLFQDKIVRDAQTALTDIGTSQWEGLVDSVAELPDDLHVHSRKHESESSVDPTKRSFRIDLREVATNAISPWPALLADAAEPLKARLTRVWSGAENLENVIDYNLDASREELLGGFEGSEVATRTRPEGEKPSDQSRFENASNLATDALRRSEEIVQEQRAALAESWAAFARTFDTAVHEDWSDLISQVKSDDVVRERWVGLRTRTLRIAERWKDRVRSQTKLAYAAFRKRASVARRVAARLIRRGRTAVGVEDSELEQAGPLAEELRGADTVRRSLPLVYRRLFSFGVLLDTGLLVGRARDLATVKKRYEAWRSGSSPGALLLSAPPGSGRTSFLETLDTKVFDAPHARLVSLDERVSSTPEFAGELAQALGMEPGARPSLERLEEHLLRRDARPAVLLLDNLEHLMLQAIGGTELLRKVMTLMIRTDHKVFWVATMSEGAWKYVEKALDGAAASMVSLPLTTLGRQDIEELVLKRHQRSGMTLSFAAPKDPTPLLKRKLQRAQSAERRQEILQGLYFDALYRQSGDDISLALLSWLRSVEFQDDGDLVSVRTFEPLSFRQLQQLDLERSFALKAFILHNTLTAEELGKILRAPKERCAMVFESLLNLSLVERVLVDTTDTEIPIDTASDRLRLSRLVVYPVIQHLRDKRILY